MRGDEGHVGHDLAGTPSRFAQPLQPHEKQGVEGKFPDEPSAGISDWSKTADKAPERERPFKQRRGRSKTCGAEFEAMALSQHRASGFMCAPYMHARIGRLVKEWEQLHGAIEAQVLDCRESCPGRQFVRSQQEVDFERTEGRTAHDIPLCVRHAENAIRTPEGGPTGDLELVRCTCIRQIGLVVASLRCAF